jgi:hypothetical protein
MSETTITETPNGQRSVGDDVSDDDEIGTKFLYCPKCYDMVNYFIDECLEQSSKVCKFKKLLNKYKKSQEEYSQKYEELLFDYDEIKAVKEELEEKASVAGGDKDAEQQQPSTQPLIDELISKNKMLVIENESLKLQIEGQKQTSSESFVKIEDFEEMKKNFDCQKELADKYLSQLKTANEQIDEQNSIRSNLEAEIDGLKYELSRMKQASQPDLIQLDVTSMEPSELCRLQAQVETLLVENEELKKKWLVDSSLTQHQTVEVKCSSEEVFMEVVSSESSDGRDMMTCRVDFSQATQVLEVSEQSQAVGQENKSEHETRIIEMNNEIGNLRNQVFIFSKIYFYLKGDFNFFI